MRNVEAIRQSENADSMRLMMRLWVRGLKKDPQDAAVQHAIRIVESLLVDLGEELKDRIPPALVDLSVVQAAPSTPMIVKGARHFRYLVTAERAPGDVEPAWDAVAEDLTRLLVDLGAEG